MKSKLLSSVAGLAIAILFSGFIADVPSKGEIELQYLKFKVRGNTLFVRSFVGSAKAIEGSFHFAGSVLKEVRVRVKIANLKTGIKRRDKHMRERIFQTRIEGELVQPDLVFAASDVQCESIEESERLRCPIVGTLAIRGRTEPFHLQIETLLNDDGQWIAKGEGVVLLSDYGIRRPKGIKKKIKIVLQVALDNKEQGEDQPEDKPESKPEDKPEDQPDTQQPEGV